MRLHDDLLEFSGSLSPLKKKLLIGGLGGVVLVVVLAITLAVVLTTYTPYSLPASGSGELLRLQRTDISRANGEFPVVARSYDGNQWEIVADLDIDSVELDCSQSPCVVKTKGTYQVINAHVPEAFAKPSPSERFARLLSQGTFGASKHELQDAVNTYGDDYLQWFEDQVKLPPTLHRQYYRERTNPPRRIGTITSPCDLGSRWHRYTFSLFDEGKALLVEKVAGGFSLYLDGLLRTEVTTFLNETSTSNATFPANYIICTVVESLDGAVKLAPVVGTCNVTLPNPPIHFDSPNAESTKVFTAGQAQFIPHVAKPDVVFLNSISTSCSLSSITYSFVGFEGNFYKFDPRLQLFENTIKNPANLNSLATTQCPAVVKTFVNAETCVRRSSCAPMTFSAAPVPLNQTILRAWFEENLRYVYYITGLRLEPPFEVSPCGNAISRWSRTPGNCTAPTALDDTTYYTIFNALNSSTDTNPYVRDIGPLSTNCTASSITIGAQIQVGAECFQHVHPDLYSVRDASDWTLYHDGNAQAIAGNRPNPIATWAEQGLIHLHFPGWHPMTRWYDRRSRIPLVGRYGDNVDFRSLPTALQTLSMAERVDALATRSEGFEACGSPGETANNAPLGHRYQMPDLTPTTQRQRELDWPHDFGSGKSMIWTNVALTAPDQLRQRVAWVLSQIFIIAAGGIERSGENEPWASFYDIFVRHAFGNYRDIMREVSYHPMMSTYLSYYQNKGFSFANTYPDENYARELMQLFSIGLWKLNDDGTPVLGPDGLPVASYTNDDIVDFARLWTGFDVQQPRSNLEERSGVGSPNAIDPLQLKPTWRDLLPKAKLDAGFLGDNYPLCDELPPQHWLTEGARYVFTGDNSIEGTTMDNENMTNVGIRGRFTPSPANSQLYQRLCQPDSTGKCTFPTEVVLTQNLPCDGQECNASRVISAKIIDTVAGVTKYYTYVSVPCVRLTFYDNGKLLNRGGTNKQCSNPKYNVGFPVCCRVNRTTTAVDSINSTHCVFANEAMNFETARSRCINAGNDMCSVNYTGSASWSRTCAETQFQWLNANCSLLVQVYPSGQIGIFDPVVSNATNIQSHFKTLRLNSNNVFRVRWNGNRFPMASQECSSNCTIVSTLTGDSCVCELTMSERAVFTDSSSVPSPQQLLSSLFVGAAKPSSFRGDYVNCTTSACAARSDVTVWTMHGKETWDTTTIFEIGPIRAGGPRLYFSNLESIVNVGDSFSFRNPPHFMPLSGEIVQITQWSSDNQWVSRAHQEVESLLDHLFEHDSTPPFVARHFIQRMVTSNPSPRYVRTVVNAFRTGTYNEHTFSGLYGDIQATVAAVLLDREARSTVVEADPTHGVLREPLLKVMHFLRAMEYRSKDTREVMLIDMDNKIGMEPYNSPTVFGFYLPENRPAGPVSDNGLVSPEAQLGVSPLVVGYLNGIVSLIDSGLTACSSGFGYNSGRNCRNANTTAETADGAFQYTPSNNSSTEVIKELDLLLTQGRLNPDIREIITKQYATLAVNNSVEALKLAQKLIVIAPEYHTTSANIHINETRQSDQGVPSQGRPYKAIVVIFLAGGSDSYNMLIPHSNCQSKDLYAEYSAVRGLAAIDKSLLLPISVPAGTQPCNVFGLHNSMPSIKSLYDSGNTLFLSNIGALVEPITKADYNKSSGRAIRLPPSLFAHNIMSRSMHNLHPQNVAAKGILGRTVQALREQGAPYRSELYSLVGTVKMLEGLQEPDYINANSGVTKFAQFAKLKEALGNITHLRSDSAFAETYARLLNMSLEKTEAIGAELGAMTLNVTFGTDTLSRQLQQVAKLIKMRTSLNTERAVFVTQRGGYDTHNTFDLSTLFGSVDAAMNSFAEELKLQGIWDSVAVLTVSEFGRTLTTNGAGTDHSWGGHHFLAGGKIRGGRILGTYPPTLTDAGEHVLGRGRMLPTNSWESVWKGLVQWFGVMDHQLNEVLPNLKNFPDSHLFGQDVLFKP